MIKICYNKLENRVRSANEMRIKNKTAMQAFANQLATYLKAQDVLLLDGDLGAGKQL